MNETEELIQEYGVIEKGATIVCTGEGNRRAIAYKFTCLDNGHTIYYWSSLHEEWEVSTLDVNIIKGLIADGSYKYVNGFVEHTELKCGNLTLRIPKDKLGDAILLLQQAGF